MSLTDITVLISEISILLGVILPVIIWVRKLINGMRCQLRSDMLRIYYRHNETGTIRQYEYEHFIYCYEAYKALKGNSFIDKIYDEVRSWEIIS